MRFQDAARDGRAVVYAAIQADPLVARAALAPGRRRSRRATPRPGGHERRADRPGDLAPDVPDPVRGHGRARTNGRGPRRSSPSRSRSPSAASRSAARSAARSSRRSPSGSSPGAGRRPSPAIRRERRILFDGVAAEIHPYDVTVETARSRRGLGLQVGGPRDRRRRAPPARRRAEPRGRRGRAADGRAGRLRRRALMPGPARAARPRPTPGPAWSRSRRSTGWSDPTRDGRS